ncbi:hypothetical protein JCM14076_03160 [Methylosoma difficile]
MKKRKNQRQATEIALQNPVAKFAHQFNKAQVFSDKTQYRRTAKHRKQEASASTFMTRMLAEAACSINTPYKAKTC